MSRKIGVIGSGHVGSTVAHYIVSAGFADELVMIDTNEAKVVADAVDLRDAMPNLPFHTNITVNDYSALKDADVVISAMGKVSLQSSKSSDRFAELPFTSAQVKDVAEQLKTSGFNGVLVDISNPCDVITSFYQQYTGLPKNQVIGTGTLLDSARMLREVSEELNVDPKSVHGYNLGEHGNSQFTAWSTVTVFDQPITELAAEKGLDLAAMDDGARKGGFQVFSGKQYTNYGVATAAVRLANAVLSNSMTVMPVSNYQADLDVYLSYPAVIGRKGVVKRVALDLTQEEQAKLQKSADFIKSNVKKYS
ncbi:L-lactate dehydrogenase [Nicoliella spurrieriana]|uniref:L-lactate dehydrogenase n=1 Tax=Nicoliella spurrieriana TaxID=2925830 RepID=A0A976RRU0_9LACO|nr:L-lactate dehydrogenase [Nicoliella spurrieriana]UQS86727.1 L-lactate dehydrogenase [Nicoliella spurrieriana]